MTTTDILKLSNNVNYKSKNIVSLDRATFVNEMIYIYKYYLNKESKKILISFKNEICKKKHFDNFVPFQPMCTYGELRFDSMLPLSPVNENDNVKYHHNPTKRDFNYIKDISEDKKKRKNGSYNTLE